ncbi:MAG: nucleotidyltransferase family protein, partial [Candidatus Heimdallarchaeaceae archaeon]
MQETFNRRRILEILQNNLSTIQSFGIKSIGIFGSYAKEEQQTRSDLDVLIEF